MSTNKKALSLFLGVLIALPLCSLVMTVPADAALQWGIQTVDSRGWVGKYTSLAVYNGDSKISYYDYDGSNQLKYAWKDAEGWHRQTVDSGWQCGWYTSLAVTSNGDSRISYFDASNQDLKYAWKDAEGWHRQTVDSTGSVGGHTSLALDAFDRPHISYVDYDDNSLTYAYKDDEGWHITRNIDTIGSGGYRISYTSIEIYGKNSPCISYHKSGDLKYAYKDAMGWHTEAVDTGRNVGAYSSLELDGSGHPHVSYSDGANDDLKYAYKDAMGWHTEAVDTGRNVGAYTSLALDARGLPRISYFEGWPNGNLKYAWKSDSAGNVGWHYERVHTAGYVGEYTSLVLDANGYPRISYSDAWNEDLKYAYGYT